MGAKSKRQPRKIESDLLLTTEEAANMLGVSIKTLERWRRRTMKRQGPPITRVGLQIRYALSGVQEWLKDNTEVISKPND